MFPVWRDATARVSNVKHALLAHLTETYGHAVEPMDVMAYIAALLAHPAFTARFREDLRQPGLRVPLTADPALFDRAVDLGREVIWLHTYGERCADPAAGRPASPPRIQEGQRPTIPAAGTIPGAPEPLPAEMRYDAENRRLHIGGGFVENVTPESAAYEVSGKNVLRQWFSYRRSDRTRPVIGDRRPPSPLDRIQPDHWLPEYTEDLLNLLHVLGRLVALETRQEALLDEICRSDLIAQDELEAAGALVGEQPSPVQRVSADAAVGDLFN